MDPEQVQMFVSITGASEDVAHDKLQAHGGNLNAAINSFYNEGEPMQPVQGGNTDGAEWMEEDEPPIRQPAAPFTSYPPSSNPTWHGGLPASRGLGLADNQPSHFPLRDTPPIVSRTRSSREAPVDWRDDAEPRVRSRAAILESENAHLPSQSPTDFVSDEDEVSGPASAVSRAQGDRVPFETVRSGADYAFGNANPSAPLPAIAHNEGADIEEEMIRAAIEASRKETTRMMEPFGEGQSGADLDDRGRHNDDDAMAWALSQSLKTAEEEKEMRRRLLHPSSPQQSFPQENNDNHLSPSRGTEYDLLHRKGSPSAKDNIVPGESSPPSNNFLSSGLPILQNPVGRIDPRDPIEEGDEFEDQPLLRRRSNRRLNPTFAPPIPEDTASLLGTHEDRRVDAYPSSSTHANGHVRENDEWGGLSSEEQHEAVMLEAAMFGSVVPEEVAARFRYPMTGGRVVDDADVSDDGGLPNYPRPAQQPLSPSVIAQRLLREQQDDEYLASLEADREKEARAKLEEEMRLVKEAEAKVAAQEEHRLRQEEEMRKSLAAEELERQLAAKRAALPEEPSVDDEAAVTLMVRMPDGSRQGRRFRKSDMLQCLFDFIDVSGAVVQGSYRLVRQYPRKALTDGEHDSSFQDLGLSSKHEVLFLELV